MSDIGEDDVERSMLEWLDGRGIRAATGSVRFASTIARRMAGCSLPTLVLVASTALASTGATLSPPEIFERVGASVTVVQSSTNDGTPLAAATAIALGDGRFVSTCAALDGSDSIRIGSADRQRVAKLLARDAQRNLCLLSAPAEAEYPAISRAPNGELPQVGERVFALSNALGLGIGLSEGVIAGIGIGATSRCCSSRRRSRPAPKAGHWSIRRAGWSGSSTTGSAMART